MHAIDWRARKRPWALAALAALAGVLTYVAIDVVLAFLDPWYSLIRNAESDYGVGVHAGLMDFNFLLRCAFSLAAVVAIARLGGSGVARRLGLAGLIAWAAASGVLAFFPDNPAGTPVTSSGRIHLLVALFAFVAVAIATPTLSHHIRSIVPGRIPNGLSLVAWLGVAALVVLMLAARPLAGDFGLFERGFLGLEILWIAMAAGRIMTLDRASTTALTPDD